MDLGAVNAHVHLNPGNIIKQGPDLTDPDQDAKESGSRSRVQKKRIRVKGPKKADPGQGAKV